MAVELTRTGPPLAPNPFLEPDVAGSYEARTPYAPALFGTLVALQSGRRRALDIGCGPGKLARVLADHFDEVVAVDPSAAALAAGQSADAGRHPNIRWVCGKAEELDDRGSFDLVTAGCSIHFPDHAALFPKLARWTSVLAVLDDAPFFPEPAPPCGMERWLVHLNRWGGYMGRPPVREPPAPAIGLERRSSQAHEAWMDIAGRELFSSVYRQSVADFVDAQHARASWNRSAMGPSLVTAFDAALTELMTPYAAGGMLEVAMTSELTWGAPRTIPA